MAARRPWAPRAAWAASFLLLSAAADRPAGAEGGTAAAVGEARGSGGSPVDHAGEVAGGGEAPVATFQTTVEGTGGGGSEAGPGSTAFVTVLDARGEGGTPASVADLLDQAPGVFVRSLGGPGSLQVVSIRGSTPGQVQVFLDGIPMDRGNSSFTDLGAVALDGVERVEVFRGTLPAHLGGGGIGGAVNLVRRTLPGGQGGSPASVEAEVSYGSFHTGRAVVAGSMPLGPARLGGTLQYRGTRGDFPYYDDNGTPLRREDDGEAVRRNNDADAASALLGLDLPTLEGSSARLVVDAGLARAGVPGLGANPATAARFARDHVTADLGWRSEGALAGDATGKEGGASLRFFGGFLRERFSDPLGEVSLGRPETDDATFTVGGRLDLTAHLPAGQTVTGSLGVTAEDYRPGGRRGGRPPGFRRRLMVGASLGDDLHLLGGRLVVGGAVRVEAASMEAEDPGDGGTPAFLVGGPAPPSEDVLLASPRLGVRVDLAPFLALLGNAGLFHRIPTFPELFGEGGIIAPSPGLRPERGRNADAGVRLRLRRSGPLDRLALEVAVFRSDVDDGIVYLQNSPTTRKAQNLGRARMEGLEVQTVVGVLGSVHLTISYTLLDTENRSDIPHERGKRLPGRPVHDFFGRLRVGGGSWSVGYEVEATGGVFLDPANLRPLPPRVIHGATARAVPWREGPEVELAVTNLLDERVEEVPYRSAAPEDPDEVPQAICDFLGFPLPGRALFLTLRWGARSAP